jgi:hypothetical protein
MAQTLTGSTNLNATFTYNAGLIGSSLVAALNAGPQGSGGAVLPNPAFLYGTPASITSGNLIVNSEYSWVGSIGATTAKNVALYGGADNDPFGTALAFTSLTYFLVAVLYPAGGTAPDALNYLEIGPRGVTHGWGGAWGGTGATVYETCYYRKEWIGPGAGASVATTDLFCVYNPGATAITALIHIVGSK